MSIQYHMPVHNIITLLFEPHPPGDGAVQSRGRGLRILAQPCLETIQITE